VLAFLDESGDPGRKTRQGSSAFFTVAIVTFTDAEEATACDARINLLRRELSLPDRYEFHFHSNARSVRLAFLEAVAPYNKYTCRLVFENAKPYLSAATVVIDKSGDRAFRNELATYLRQRINDPEAHAIKSVKMEQSRTNNLIQLADYIAGVVNRHVTGKPDAAKYRRLIASREITQRVWPVK
jgi:hypothetical protein